MKNLEHLHVQIFVNIYLCIKVLIILYNELLHKYEFGQAHCEELNKKSPIKFSLPFFSIAISFMNFGSFLIFLGLNNSENDFLNSRTVSGPIRPGATAHGTRRPATRGRLKGWLGLGLVARFSREMTCGAPTGGPDQCSARRRGLNIIRIQTTSKLFKF
jgi:hypothetical protein